jgi:O-antigen/teichoic acid export membrane protein
MPDIGILKELLRHRLRHESFSHKVALITVGSLVGQGLVVLASPVLTRLYAPQDFGTLALFTALSALLSTFISLRYEQAILLPVDERKARALLFLSLLVATLIGSGLLASVLLMHRIAVTSLRTLEQPHLIWLIPCSAWLISIYQCLSLWATRIQAYHAIAQTRIQQGFGITLAQIGLGGLNLGGLGILVGDLVGRAMGITRLIRLLPHPLKPPSLAELWEVARVYWRFPVIAASSTLINRLGLHLLPLAFAALYGSQLAGWYLLAQRMLGMPSNLVGQSLAQVYFGESARLYRGSPNALKEFYGRLVKRLILFGALPTVVAGALFAWSCGFLFGAEWVIAGPYLLLLSPMFAVQLVVSPLSQTLIVMGRQDLQLTWDIARVAVVLGTLQAASRLNWEAVWAVGAVSLVMTFMYILLGIITWLALQRTGCKEELIRLSKGEVND